MINKQSWNRKIYSRIYLFLIKTVYIKEKIKFLNKYWQKLASQSFSRYNGTIFIKIHGYPAIVNNGYPYSINARIYRTFNNPLLELVNLTFQSKKSSLNIIDIGAAVGDTALFLLANAQNKINNIFCIDGDDEFFNYLTINIKEIKEIHAFKALLSDGSKSNEKKLIRTHAGSASAQGESYKDAISLDELLEDFSKNGTSIDVIKIDVDGFDGKVLAGAVNILEKFVPSIIFEWHPILYELTQNDIHQPFEILQQYGYDFFIWFDKYGNFNHFDLTHNKKETELIKQICMNGKHHFDWHYDIVALHKTSEISLISLAEMQYAKSKKSSY